MALITDDPTSAATLISEDISSTTTLVTEDTTATPLVVHENKAAVETLSIEDTTKATLVPVNINTGSVFVFPESESVPSKIEEGLYLGSVKAALTKDTLKKLNITHILGLLILSSTFIQAAPLPLSLSNTFTADIAISLHTQATHTLPHLYQHKFDFRCLISAPTLQLLEDDHYNSSLIGFCDNTVNTIHKQLLI